MGRFALELFEGPTLIERVRFDFPLLGAPRARRTPSPSFAGKLRTRIGVVFPATKRGTRLELWDRATGRRWSLPWPPRDAPGDPPWPVRRRCAPTDPYPRSAVDAVRANAARPEFVRRSDDPAMQCPTCQAPLEDSQRFCPNCGTVDPGERRSGGRPDARPDAGRQVQGRAPPRRRRDGGRLRRRAAARHGQAQGRRQDAAPAPLARPRRSSSASSAKSAPSRSSSTRTPSRSTTSAPPRTASSTS